MPITLLAEKNYLRLSAALFAVLAAVMALTIRDYGVIWDEPGIYNYGKLAFRYYASGLREIPQGAVMNLYGASFELPVTMAIRLLPWPEYIVRHVVNAGVGLLGIWGTCKTATLIAGPGAGFWAALLLALTPCYYGHMFNNPKDLPFAAGHIWTLYFLLRYARTLPRPPLSVMMELGLSIGWTSGVRVGGLMLLGYLVLVWLVHAIRTGNRRIGATLAIAGIGCLTMLVFWPYAQRHPLTWPFQTLWSFTHANEIAPIMVPFKGKIINGSNLPWEYVPWHLFINLPEIILVLLAGGMVAVIRAAVRPGRIRIDKGWAGMVGLVAMTAVLPVLLVIFLRPPIYNGLRHLLFVIPPVACMAGIVLNRWVALIGNRGGPVAWAAGAAFAAYLGWHVSIMVRLHPMQYIYYNQVVGGFRGGGDYELDYWGNSYPEAIRILVKQLNEREGPRWPMLRYRVYACGAMDALAAELPDSFVMTDSPLKADFYFGIMGGECRGWDWGKLVVQVTRFGMPLSYVRDNRTRVKIDRRPSRLKRELIEKSKAGGAPTIF